MIFCSRRPNRARYKDIDHSCAAIWTIVTATIIVNIYLKTIRAELRSDHSCHTLLMPLREHHDDLIVSLKIAVVERFQIVHRRILAFIQNGDPSCNPAITAIYDRKILFRLLGIQVMGNLISDLLRVNLRNKTAQLSHPKLYLNEQERTQFSRCPRSCMRNQGKQGINYRFRIRIFFQLWVVNRKIFCNLGNLIIVAACKIDDCLHEAMMH